MAAAGRPSRFDLRGGWKFSTEGSDASPDLDGVLGIPNIALMCAAGDSLTIDVEGGDVEEISIMGHVGGRRSVEYHQLGKLNYHDCPKIKSPVASSVVFCNDALDEFSVLSMGPGREQRSLIHFRLDASGNRFRADIQMLLPNFSHQLTLVKYFARSDTKHESRFKPIIMQTAAMSRAWLKTNTTPPELARVSVKVSETVDLSITATSFTHTVPAHNAKYSDVTPLRRIRDTYKPGVAATYYALHVQFEDLPWTVIRRFKEFDALHSFVCSQISGTHTAPVFPGKTLLKVTGDGLDKRATELGDYMKGLLGALGFGKPNIVEALFAFLEIPEHLGGDLGGIGSVRESGVSPGMKVEPYRGATMCDLPQDRLHMHLSKGLIFLKHSRSRFASKPQPRLLRCDAGVKILYWGEFDTSNPDTLDFAADTVTKSIPIVSIRSVIRGAEPSAGGAGKHIKSGSPNLQRKGLSMKQRELSLSIVTQERSLDLECTNLADFEALFYNLNALVKKMPPS